MLAVYRPRLWIRDIDRSLPWIIDNHRSNDNRISMHINPSLPCIHNNRESCVVYRVAHTCGARSSYTRNRWSSNSRNHKQRTMAIFRFDRNELTTSHVLAICINFIERIFMPSTHFPEQQASTLASEMKKKIIIFFYQNWNRLDRCQCRAPGNQPKKSFFFVGYQILRVLLLNIAACVP